MLLVLNSSLLVVACFMLNTHALPRPRPDATYSVVNVDGGSQATPTPTVVYQTITQSDDTPTTISVTMTAVVTDHTTQWTHAQATETALIPEVSAQPAGSPTNYIPVPIPSPTEDATVTVVSMVTASPTTTQYYDNGQWHTSYPIETDAGYWTPSTAAATSSSSWQASGSAAPSGFSSSYGWNSSASH